MIVSLLAWLPTASGFTPIAQCNNGVNAHWEDLPTTWRLRSPVNSGSASTALTDAEIETHNLAAWQVWSDTANCCNDFSSTYLGLTTSPRSSNQNVIEFEEGFWNPANGWVNSVIAVTATSYNPATCEILSGDQIYNSVGFQFSVTDPPGPGETDFQSIAAHENGHWLGLGHTPTGGATMFASYGGGVGPRTLENDDQQGVCAAYPAACGPAETQCGNGVDDDGDGAADCDDSDCAAFPVCTCATNGVVGCNNTIQADNFGGQNTVDTYDCVTFESTGPESVYTFTPTVDGPVDVEISGLTADLDLFVTEMVGNSCDPDQCVAQAGSADPVESLTFQGQAGVTYAVVADGFDGAQGSFTLDVQCANVPPPAGDCLPDPTPVPCGGSISSSNVGAANNVLDYSCVDFQMTGPEVAHQVVPGADGTVTVTMSGLNADLDLFVTTDSNGRCTPGSCIGASHQAAASDETVTFEGLANTAYYVVADGWDGATSSFQLAASCAPGGTPPPSVPPTVPPAPPTTPPPATEPPADTDIPAVDDTDATVVDDTGVVPYEPIECGCSGGGGAPPWMLVVLAPLVLRVRR